MSKVAITKSKLDNLANAVAAKSGEPVLLTVDEMTSAVLGISVGEENVLEGIKVNGVELPIVNKKVNIPIINLNPQTESQFYQAGVITPAILWDFEGSIVNYVNDNIPGIKVNEEIIGPNWDDTEGHVFYELSIPTATSDLTNDSGFITSETDPTVPSWAKATNKPTYTAAEVGAISISHVVNGITNTDINNWSNKADLYTITIGSVISGDIYEIDKNYSDIITKLNSGINVVLRDGNSTFPFLGYLDIAEMHTIGFGTSGTMNGASILHGYLILPNGTAQHVYQTYIIPANTSDLTNDSGYLTSSDIASVLKYKGTKASYSALPSSGNVTGDVWHLTDTGAEWAWDGSAWQELGTAIDVSGFVSKSGDTMSGTLDMNQEHLKFQNTAESGSRIVEIYGSTFRDNYNEVLGQLIITRPIAVSNTPVTGNHLTNKTYVDNAINAISIPTKTSDLTNDSGFLTSYTETDPTVPSWAKQSTKPSYALSEITSADDIKAIEALTGTSGLLRKTAANTWSLDTNTYLTSYTETDPTVPAWAKQSTKPTYTASEVGALPASTTIPSKTSNLTNDSGFITGYTETDPVFSASAAAGITSTDISNWNSKTSNTGTVTSITLTSGTGITVSNSGTAITESGSRTVSLNTIKTSKNTSGLGGAQVWKSWESSSTITSPSTIGSYTGTFTVNNSSTVSNRFYPIEATYDGHLIVNIPWESAPTKTSDLTNDSGYLTLATLPIYDGTVV